MADANPGEGAESLPKAKIRPGHPWWVWLVPLGALSLCVWFVFRDYVATGPVIKIYFENAEGLEEQNTPVKYRGAEVGRVKTIRLTKDGRRVEVQARLAGAAEGLARAGSAFWIVRPEVKVGAVSGLRTLITGEYIAVQPGGGPQTNTFVGAVREPLFKEGKGLEVALLSPNLDSLQEQSPIIYRGVQVGEVLRYQLGLDAREVVIHGLIRPEYAPLVRLNTRFWNAGGVSFHVGLFKGVEMSAESVKTLVTGGIEFATPPDYEEPARNGATFRLSEKPENSWKTWAPAIKLRLPESASETHSASPVNIR